MTKQYYYKAMSYNMEDDDFKFKVGETYTIESEELELCSDKVFHFCEKLEDTIQYYSRFSDRHFLIEVLGDIFTEGNISGSNKIRVVKEINREEIEEYIQDKDSLKAKRFVALFTTNIKRIEELSKSESWEVLMAIASNPNTSVYLLEKLAKNEHFYVRKEVAENSNTPIYLLEDLAKDEDLWVREVVALNPNTPACLLKELAKNEYYRIRLAVTINPNTPPNILELLVKDENEAVRNEAQERLKEIT